MMLDLIHSKLSSKYKYAIVADAKRMRFYKDEVTIVVGDNNVTFYKDGVKVLQFDADELELLINHIKMR